MPYTPPLAEDALGAMPLSDVAQALIRRIERLEQQQWGWECIPQEETVLTIPQEETVLVDELWEVRSHPLTCPCCRIGWESTDLRRTRPDLYGWWGCSNCGATWSEGSRAFGERRIAADG